MRSALFLAVFAVASARGGCTPTDPAPYDPCGSSACGDPCRLCPPDDAGCFETAVVKACDGAGECVPGPVECGPPTPYDPCAGKACGDYCDPCIPGEPCPMYFAATACDPAGQCVTAGTFKCEPPPPPPTGPCDGKRCGDACSNCDPTPGTACPAVMMFCDAAGACGYAYPVCE